MKSVELIQKPFVLIRHGETPLNQQALIGGRTDVALTENGREQAQSLAPFIQAYDFDLIAVSPLIRAKETADLLFPEREKVIVAGIRERDWGLLEEQPQTMQLPYEETPPEGESWETFILRVVEGLNEILNISEFPLVIAHSGVFRVLRQLAYGSPYGARVNNVVPYLVIPGDREGSWEIRTFF